MKAFVIKNKEGKYLISIDNNHKGHFGKDLFSAEKFHCRGNAKDFCPKDCDVVEITIAEGDLEQENKQLKEQLAIRDKMIEIASEHFIFYMDEKEHKKELKRQFIFWEKLAKESLKND